jgi:thymidylate kinase
VNAAGLDGVWPDLVVVLELDAKTGLAREEETDRIGREGLELQERVAAAYREVAAADSGVVFVDGSRTIPEVVRDSVAVIRERLIEPV